MDMAKLLWKKKYDSLIMPLKFEHDWLSGIKVRIKAPAQYLGISEMQQKFEGGEAYPE